MDRSASAMNAHQMSLESVFTEPELNDEQGNLIRLKQFALATMLTPIILMASLVNCAVIVMSYWGDASRSLLGFWAFAHCFICAAFFLISLREKSLLLGKKRCDEQNINKFSRGSMVLGFLWGVVPVIVVPYTDPMGQMTLGTIMSGMLFASAFMLSRLPRAAFAFMATVVVGLVVSLLIEPDPRSDFLTILTFTYFGALAVCVRWSFTQYVQQHLDAAAVAEQGEVIGLLLKDFEESTSDWLWQTDSAGMLQEIPLTVTASKSGYDIMESGRPLLTLFKPNRARNELEACLASRTGFRDVELQVDADDGPRWWLLTGKPLFSNGEFVGFRGVASDMTSSKKSEDQIAYMAHHDGLTGLPNRANLHAEIERSVQRPPSPGVDRALLLMDLDNFKWVNDTLGHPAGDELLRLVTQRLLNTAEDHDFIARLGGDEFALIVERPEEGGALSEFLDDLIGSLSEPYHLWGSTAQCSASIGVRPFDAYAMDARTLLKHADLALYKAKQNGRAQWAVFTQDLDDRSRARRQLEDDLRKALDQGELAVFYQPLIDAATQQVVSAEALLRWRHPTRGLVQPTEFIELAEDTGLITRIGAWTIHSAIEAANKFPDGVGVSINISPVQILSADFIATIEEALGNTELSSDRVELEITESVLMTETETTFGRLQALKDLGVKIALDDFGTGFSSLSYLRRFPFDKIKIDKSFISDLETSDDSRAITIATLGLAKSLGLRCTAEGVETAFQSDFLRAHGCDELQGFFVSRAQPLENLVHFLGERPDPSAIGAGGPRLKLVSMGSESDVG